jgi:hypothetical protein
VNNVTLHRWEIVVEGDDIIIDFKNFKGIPESQRSTFKNDFQVPAVCARAMPCPEYRRKGLLRPRQLSAVERLQQWRAKVKANK